MADSYRKEKLYDLGRRAIGKLAKREIPGYVCPICLRVFECLDELTEEHVPPASVGGKVLCLTCRECNCGAGHSVDAQVHREKLSRCFLGADGGTKRAKMVVEGIEVNIDLRWDEKGPKIQVLGGENNPKTVGALKAALAGVVKSGRSFNLRDAVSYSRRDADIGYLKSAYLAAFAKLGYTYILRAALNRVRQQIQEPTCRVLETVRVYAGGLGSFGSGFVLINEPIRCLGVKIDDSLVCLPLGDGDDVFYEKLAEMRSSGRALTWHGKETIEWPRRLELALDFA
jgi:hypothetical protein